MGNTLTNRYDPNGNVVQESVYGELVDVPGSAGNVRLKDATRDYDAMNRLRQADTAFFNTTNQAPIGAGVASTRIEWNGVSQLVRLVNANGHATTVTYDTAQARSLMNALSTLNVRVPQDISIAAVAGDEEALHAALLNIQTHPEEARQRAVRAKEKAQQFSINITIEKLVTLLKNV